MSRRARARLATVGLVAAALLSDGWWTLDLVRLVVREGAVDPAAGYGSRFDELRTALPRLGVVGYLSDRPEAAREYYLTQYSLAPLVVDHSAEHELIVGNFFDEELGARLVASGGFVVIRDFGVGLVLLRRAGQ